MEAVLNAGGRAEVESTHQLPDRGAETVLLAEGDHQVQELQRLA